MDDLLRDFLTESNESLVVVDGELIKLEADPNNKDVLQKIFRLVHTIKGTCGFIGLPRLEKVAHASENVLGKFRDGEVMVTPDAVTLILESLDRIKEILGGIEQAEAEPKGDDGALISRLHDAASGVIPPSEKTAEQDALPSVEALAVQPAFSPDLVTAVTTAPAAAKPAETTVANQSIRVNVQVIEQLIVMVSELVLTRNQLLEMVRHTKDSEFKVPLQRLSNVTAELQESIMKTRMQPIGNAWAKLPRIVRDLANELGKKIDLQMYGADTELDRQVLELIKDPLTHMIRNSGDHGLEVPAERRAVGKAETGLITLRAYHEGGHILVEIADDGRGLPTDKIKAKAIAAGLVSETEGARMTDDQIHRLIFQAGLSTASKVTNVSGRGVGMDVVRSNIELIGGSIDLKSKSGQGMTVTIKIPLTMAIVSALIVGVRDMRFAIPQICVMELVRAADGSDIKIERINQTLVLRLRDRLLPLVRLSEILQLPPEEERGATDAYIVVAQAAGRTFGIVVDTVFETGEIVVKPVSPVLKEIPMFSGNTILGDGSVIMILDPNGIAAAVSGEIAQRNAAEEVTAICAAAEPKQTLLLFKAGDVEPKAVPLGAVTRLERVDVTKFERSNGGYVLQYRGALMPIVTSLNNGIRESGEQPVLVFSEDERAVGVVVDEILDIVDATLKVELANVGRERLGTAVIREKATEIVNIAHYIADAFLSSFSVRQGTKRRRRVLVVEDSSIYRTILVPLLVNEGCDVVEAATPEAALKLREEGRTFDIILCDVDMTGVDGQPLAATLKEERHWHAIPMVGLATDIETDSRASFDFISHKFDYAGLLSIVKSQATKALAA
jgi:two-component system chemotaxis sensor kinase CheA